MARSPWIAVVHIDYRNHASSDTDPNADVELRLGYVEDAINAVLAIRAARLPSLDGDRVGMLGRSMGGGVTLGVAVVAPDLVDALVVHASVSSNVVDNFEKWTRPRRELAAEIVRRYGEPAAAPAFWRNVSPATFFERVARPIQMHHGDRDDTCPPAWSRTTADELRAAGKQVELLTYPGEGHAFDTQWSLQMQRTKSFFDRHLA